MIPSFTFNVNLQAPCCGAHQPTPVSYTHLDVYKRQTMYITTVLIFGIRNSLFINLVLDFQAVSYTHLNRLVIHKPLRCMDVPIAVAADIKKNVSINMMRKKMQRKIRS